MSRYIDADALKMDLYSIIKADCGYTADVLAGLMIAERVIDNAPTVDAVQVVRCRDGKHCRVKGRSEASAYCEDVVICTNGEVGAGGWLPVFENYFCAYGKRRTDNG